MTTRLMRTIEQLAEQPVELEIDLRRRATRNDPIRFAELYLPHHLMHPETKQFVGYSQFHLDLAANAKTWMGQSALGEHRDCYVAPRQSGKSTWIFTILPLWAAAHGHRKFIAAFADTATQAETHLATFKRELENNILLRLDYPELCAPARRRRGGSTSDTQAMYIAQSGFIFAAKGADTSSLGMKYGEQRPDLIVLDDIEPHEGKYSEKQKGKRLLTVVEAVFALGQTARIVIAGTVTMYGSLIHDLVRTVDGSKDAPLWPTEENVKTHYYPVIQRDALGQECSLWPGMWPMEWIERRRHTREFLKNMMNQPVAIDGGFWDEADFQHPPPGNVTTRVLSIDPAVSPDGDYTGIAVIGFDPTEKRCTVESVIQGHYTPSNLRSVILGYLNRSPSIRAVLIETNQGGYLWNDILANLPVRVVPIKQSDPKTTRAAQALDWYQRGYVAHTGDVHGFEQQAMSFPQVVNDDMVDAVCTGLAFYLKNRDKPVSRSTSSRYI